MLPQATLAKRARHAKLANVLSLKALRRVVENTVGDVVQLVRTLPCQLESPSRVYFYLLPRHLEAGHDHPVWH
jgi:hypothetical protein